MQKGSPEASVLLPLPAAYAQYHGQLKRFFARQCRPQDAEDLVQTVWERLLRYPPREMLRAPRDYLFAIAWMVLHRYRNSGGGIVAKRYLTCDPQVIEELVDQVAGDNALVDRVDTLQQLERLLAELPSTHAAALVLLKRDGLSYEEIAATLQLSVHTVKKYIAKGLAHFKDRRKAEVDR